MEDLDAVSELRKEPGNLLWAEVDVDGLSPQDVATIAEEFGLHPLAVEDAIRTKQRPKLDTYEEHMFLVFHQLDERNGQLEASQMAIFAGERWVITIHEGCTRILEEAKKRWRDDEDRLRDEPPYLVHTLIDVAVDDYEAIADGLEEDVEELEERVLESPLAPVQRPSVLAQAEAVPPSALCPSALARPRLGLARREQQAARGDERGSVP